MIKNRVAVLNKIGYTESNMETVVTALKKRDTKAANDIVARIAESTDYAVLTDGDNFTILSTWHTTKKEQAQIGRVLAIPFKSIELVVDPAGYRQEWHEAANADQRGGRLS